MKKIILTTIILLSSVACSSPNAIKCEVVPLEEYGFTKLHDGKFEEKVCKNILDDADFTIVHIENREGVKDGTILEVEFNKYDEVLSMKRIDVTDQNMMLELISDTGYHFQDENYPDDRLFIPLHEKEKYGLGNINEFDMAKIYKEHGKLVKIEY